ncbi:winged helix-turn-helix domain-containing protein [Enterococcus pallens]|uniref:OmpR/PhoB-type domain-containing protein n=1 Tax=Enterococcus pallens ATCC BAA-351 TaxID=1158607 RepID=R2SDX6_9ENTE|nr:winged helix-turn-helix domain-containing protein [Enterococcus pallens]EOH93735.1 hypothetical protein UAU_02431 [Enterococcus pallens ATCC BAA-351]EOU24575.1 hypothetical protein I588_00562 [Enterococcus pallens ATCC BAA-351]
MCNIMIITRNILVEQQLQQRLQHLGHEVFCTGIETCHAQLRLLVEFFDSIILSETLSNEDAQLIIDQVESKEQPIEVLRKVETLPSKEQSSEFAKLGIKSYLSIDASLEELREKYAKQQKSWVRDTKTVFNLVTKRSYVNVHLAKNEKKLMKILLENAGSCVERNIICEKIWDNQPTNSSMSQLSALIKKIQTKFEEAGLEHKLVLTYWGRGYQINPQAEEAVQEILGDNDQWKEPHVLKA